jgi:hypothetical protein
MLAVEVPSSTARRRGEERAFAISLLRFFASDGLRLDDITLVVEPNVTTVRSMSPQTWNEVYELVGRIQYKAIESCDWQVARDADRITMLLQNLPEEPPAARSL